ncbi:hypothetical protein TNCV_1779321 [Trichonephila clavipes]|nr:hypothetical protein TNCV_1779321 [Trichonephila clavipes]
MAQIRAEEAAEQRATKHEDALLRVRQSRSAKPDKLRSQQREHSRLKGTNKEQHVSLIIALHSGTTHLRIIV